MTMTPQLPTWNVAMLGPSRVGKTSLLTALKVAADDYFDGSPVDVRPEDDVTRLAFARNNTLMLSELMAGRFSPDLEGDQEAQQYGLKVTSGVDTHVMSLRFKDFPGGWLATSEESYVRKELMDSPTVMMPIDAALLMEADGQHSAPVLEGLGLAYVEPLVVTWAKERTKSGDPMRLLLVPVKCESYFNDNGGRFDKSDKLFKRVKEVYGRVVDRYLENAPDGELLYAPVDTIGPIELMDVSWVNLGDGRRTMKPEYRVRRDGSGTPLGRKVKGAEPILAHLIRDVLDTQRAALLQLEDEANDAIRGREAEAQRRRSNWFKRILDNLSGHHEERMSAIAQAQADLQSLDESITKLARSADAISAKDAARVRRWS
jgi:hypothetical protein